MGSLPDHGGKFFATNYEETIGGIATNAALALAKLGADVSLVGATGNDTTGDQQRHILQSANIDTSRLIRNPDARSAHSAIMIDTAGERMIINHTDPALYQKMPLPEPGWFEGVSGLVCDPRWLEGSYRCLDIAREMNITGLVDYDSSPIAPDHGLIERASHVIFGGRALEDVSGHKDPEAGLSSLAESFPDTLLAVTLGERGVLYLDNGQCRHQSALEVDVVSTLGAGDVFHAAATLALAEGMTFPEALNFARYAAAVKVSRPPALDAMPTRDDVQSLMETLPCP